MKKVLLLIVMVAGVFSATLFAQTPAMVNWQCMPPDSQQVSAVGGNLAGLPQIGSPGFVVRDYNNGPGPDQRWWPYADGAAVSWGEETDQVNTRWVQFAVYPNPNFDFHADSMVVYLGAKGTNMIRANVITSFDTSFTITTVLNDTTLELVKDTDSLYTFIMDQDVLNGDTLYVRVYPWYTGGQSTSKYLYLRDCTIYGTTQSLGFPASATWELSDPASGGTGLTVAVSGLVTGQEELLNNTEINKYSGPDNSQRLRIAGNSWPANQLMQIDSVYVQFAVAPNAGCKLTVTSASLGIAAASINTMKANIYYDTDPNFTAPTLVDYTTPDTSGNNYLPIDALVPVLVNPNVVVEDSQAFYLRVYPWVDNDPAVRTGKYVCLKNVVIGGELEGAIIFDPPTVGTTEVTGIATTFASSGGNVSSDGGSPVTVRGVCWNTTGEPTTADAKTEDGEGSGSFTSQVTGLTAGTTYFLRAYATNVAGTAYGEELTFATLDSTTVPTVVTGVVSNVMVTSAQCGGEVTMWGGDSVTVRGVCWNTTGNPSIADDKTENGSGLGTFTGILYPLAENTTYYVCAYAGNSIGVGYGQVDSFTTQTPAPPVNKVVAADGSGDYTTVQAAFDEVPDFYTGPYTISVKAGVYYEKLMLDRNKTNVILQGEDPLTTILTFDDYAGKAGGTSNSQSVAIDADDFIAMDITFQNTVVNDGSVNDQQAVALRVNGDRQSYFNCRLLGYQDTFYAWGGRGTGRVYMKNCYIEGSVDFIFGRDIVVFDSCEVHINRDGGALTAASTEPETSFGLVFRNCAITADSLGFNGVPITSFILGRPWQKSPRTVFMYCEEPASVSPAGWSTWNVPPALYAEYMCFGPGSDYSNRINISRQLTNEEAADYTLENIFAKTSNPGFGYDWMPSKPTIITAIQDNQANVIPTSYALMQNYPNPFNPVTSIKYALPETGKVKISVFNVRGELVATLVDCAQSAGYHEVKLNAANYASGMYFYRMEAGHYVKTNKMILIK